MDWHEGAGIRFLPPRDWEVDEAEDGSRTTFTVQAPDGVAFALITVDHTEVEPAAMVIEAVEAIRGDYPNLESVPGMTSVLGVEARGFDLAFITLDMTNSAIVRGLRSSNQSYLLLGQWSEIDREVDSESEIFELFRSIEEMDFD